MFEYNINERRKTKIICTVGPSSRTPETIEALINNGMNVARLNFSHGSFQEHGENIEMIRAAAKKLNKHVAIMQDLQGPKIRIGDLPKEGVLLQEKQVYKFASLSAVERLDNSDDIIPVQYENIQKDLQVDEKVLMADGTIGVKIEKIEGPIVYARCFMGGMLYSRKGINMPSSDLKIKALTDKDMENLKFGLEQKLEIIAFSFIRKADDLKPALELISKHSYNPRVIAKIEKPQAVENLESILSVVNGVMVARGDLGVEMPLESLPTVQKYIIDTATKKSKSIITATQMLQSMNTNPVATRAESTDIANAILDGTDAVMLSDETASGEYPVEACAFLHKVALATEQYFPYFVDKFDDCPKESVQLAVSRAGVSIAEHINAKCIVAYTSYGDAVIAISKFKPAMPIYAFSEQEHVVRRLNLLWGVEPLYTENEIPKEDEIVASSEKTLLERGLVEKGDAIVVLSSLPRSWSGNYTNFLRVKIVGEDF